MAYFVWPSQHPTTASAALVAAVALLSYLAYSRYYLEQSRRAFRHRHGCQPPAAFQRNRGPLGLRNLFHVIKARNSHTILELFDNRHKDIGPTYVMNTPLRTVVFTNEPENIKCALATRFEDWCVILRRAFTDVWQYMLTTCEL